MSMTTEPVELVIERNGAAQIDSMYRLIILAGLRSKQLLRGSAPRIKADPLKRKNTSIALEELRQGLVDFTVRKSPIAGNGSHS